jgi:hypothetical protein
MQMAVECGITAVVEPQSGLDDLTLYQQAREEGALRPPSVFTPAATRPVGRSG